MKEYTENHTKSQYLDDIRAIVRLEAKIASIKSQLAAADKRKTETDASKYVEANAHQIADEALQLFTRITAPHSSFPVIAGLARLRSAALNS